MHTQRGSRYAVGFLLRSGILLAALAAVAPLAAPIHAQTVTVGASRQSQFIPVGFGFEGTAGSSEIQLGQVFRTPDNISTSLSSWSIWASNYMAANSASGEFTTALLQLSIVEWDGSNRVGPTLYSSGTTIAPTSATLTPDEFTFGVGLTLDPTKMYLALVTALDQGVLNQWSPVSFSCNSQFCQPGADLYTDGGMVLYQSAFDPATQLFRDISDQPYTIIYGSTVDMTFQATFDAPVTATPEPASMTLMATGLVGMAGFVRRRRKNAVVE